MTNGGYLTFNNEMNKNLGFKLLKDFNCFGFKIFQVSNFADNKIFYRIQIKSKKIINKNHKSSTKYLLYEKKIKKNISISKHESNDLFLKNIEFIKTTGKHINTGTALYRNINSYLNEDSNINNSFLFNIMKDFFINEKKNSSYNSLL